MSDQDDNSSEKIEKDSLKEIIDLKDAVIHTPVRLALLIFLLPRMNASFPEIQSALQLTAGNLSSHIKKLESFGLINVDKMFIENKPTTMIQITPLGSKTINDYATTLQNILNNIK